MREAREVDEDAVDAGDAVDAVDEDAYGYRAMGNNTWGRRSTTRAKRRFRGRRRRRVGI